MNSMLVKRINDFITKWGERVKVPVQVHRGGKVYTRMQEKLLHPVSEQEAKYRRKLYPKERITPEERRRRYQIFREAGLSPEDARKYRDFTAPQIERRLKIKV